ncbi:hypothetical protein FEI13_07160 [Halomonas urmiana]|uniref:CN hydrolase domain-containing protein n=1 Tax=Halomonas urmiana TaxID=490901 RepID=A0A5R8MID7_9GAMM|nr:hypothetical protein FEI13_07160 [Halomonas urmiana]
MAARRRFERDRLYAPEEWVNVGNAVIIAPSGEVVAGPLNREKGILYAEIDVEAARRARRSLDVCGHYARPDIFSLSVSRAPQPPVVFSAMQELAEATGDAPKA